GTKIRYSVPAGEVSTLMFWAFSSVQAKQSPMQQTEVSLFNIIKLGFSWIKFSRSPLIPYTSIKLVNLANTFILIF
ncbi:MAG: hypothetical protein MJA30_30405, partial [Cytophagales bacterium]|nr:hypothetical protein [Cytophagales bacterium]